VSENRPTSSELALAARILLGQVNPGVGPVRTAVFRQMHVAGVLGAYVDDLAYRMVAGQDPEPLARLWAVLHDEEAA